MDKFHLWIIDQHFFFHSVESTPLSQDKNSQMLIKAVSWLCFKNNSISRFKSSPFTFHPQAKDVESPMVSRLQHLCGSSPCIGGQTMRPILRVCLVCFISLFLLILQLHPMFWSFWVQFEMHNKGWDKQTCKTWIFSGSKRGTREGSSPKMDS